MKEGEGISQQQDIDNIVVIARGKSGWGYIEVGKERENGDICNSVNFKDQI